MLLLPSSLLICHAACAVGAAPSNIVSGKVFW
jgi:hypothetical protein